MLRKQMLVARCSTAEKGALQEIARLERRNLSEQLRELVREEARRRGFWPPDQD
jgi:hypothetical protein